MFAICMDCTLNKMDNKSCPVCTKLDKEVKKYLMFCPYSLCFIDIHPEYNNMIINKQNIEVFDE